MICPDCNSVIPQRDQELVAEVKDAKTYEHTCIRCYCKITVTIVILKHGSPELIKKFKDWLDRDRK